MSAAPSPVNSSDAAEIPVLDLAPYLSGQSAARERLARQLCHALENIGFYFIKGHGVPQSLMMRHSPRRLASTPSRWTAR